MPISQAPLKFYRDARTGGDFEAGIEMALRAVLVSPEFLFRVEQDPAGVAPNTAYRISDLELASRLSFFLWSSIPDDELLDAATRRQTAKRPPCSNSRCGACWPTRARARWSTTSPTSGSTCAIWHRPIRTCAFPGLRRQPAPGLPPGNRTVLREHHARRPQRARSAAGELHVRQRAPRQALRNPQRLRQPLPPRHVRAERRARRPAAPGQHSDRDLLRHAHLAGDPRQVDPRQHSRRAAAASAGHRLRR